jgi:hypothetical protein
VSLRTYCQKRYEDVRMYLLRSEMEGREKHAPVNRIDFRLMAWDNEDPGLRLIVVTVRKAKQFRKESTERAWILNLIKLTSAFFTNIYSYLFHNHWLFYK